MKKKLLILVVVLFAGGAGTLFWLASNANSLIESRRADIERIASDALSAKVTFGKVDTSFFPEARVTLADLNIAPKEPQSNAKGVTLKSLVVHVGLFPLLKGALDVTKLSLTNPSITLVSKDGGISVEGLPPAAPNKKGNKKGASGPKGPKQKKDQKGAGAAPAALPSWLSFQLESFSIEDALITYRDEKANSELAVKDINVDASVSLANNTVEIPLAKTSLTLPGDVSIRTDLTGVRYNLTSQDAGVTTLKISFPEGTVKLSIGGNAATMAFSGNISSDGIALKPFAPLIKVIAPDAPLSGLAGAVSPNFKIATKSATEYSLTGALGLKNIGVTSNDIVVAGTTGAVNLDVNQTRQLVQSKEIATTVGDQALSIAMDLKNTKTALNLSSLNVSGFGGVINVQTDLSHNDSKPLTSTVSISGVDIGRALSALKPGSTEVLSGVVKNFSSKVHASLGAADLMKSISGGGSLELVDAKLKQVNLAAEVLGAITDLPFLTGGQSLGTQVQGEEQEELNKDYTSIHRMTADFSLGNSAISLRQLDVVSTLFSLLGKGTSTFAGDVKLDTTILFSQALSASLVGAVKELEHALDAEERLPIPLVIEGVAPSLTVLPDTRALAKQAAKTVVKKQAGKLIEKALGEEAKGVGKALENILGF